MKLLAAREAELECLSSEQSDKCRVKKDQVAEISKHGYNQEHQANGKTKLIVRFLNANHPLYSDVE
jgi:hypothetical protein